MANWPGLKRSLIAILRGITPPETPAIIKVLVEAGFEAIEIPLNSPDPFESISHAVNCAPKNCLIGAGTVLTVDQVNQLHLAGGKLMVSPNVNRDVIKRASSLGMITMPGVFTATEALQAVDAGAHGLKFFPASILGPDGINAIKAVIPPELEAGAVGGVSEDEFEAYAKSGIKTFGLGSSLYKPGASAQEVSQKADRVIKIYDRVFGS